MRSLLSISLLLEGLGLIGLVRGQWGCAPEGPKFARPLNIKNSDFVANATQNITLLMNDAIKGRLKSGWTVENTSFSIAIISKESKLPFYEYHYLAPNNNNGTKRLDGNSRYHIGSMTKWVTDLLLLRTGIDLDSPITTWIPELSNPNSTVQWKDITVRMLADHLSGIPPNCMFLLCV